MRIMKKKTVKVAECAREIPMHMQAAARICIAPSERIHYAKNIYKDGQFFLELSNGEMIPGKFFNY